MNISFLALCIAVTARDAAVAPCEKECVALSQCSWAVRICVGGRLSSAPTLVLKKQLRGGQGGSASLKHTDVSECVCSRQSSSVTQRSFLSGFR